MVACVNAAGNHVPPMLIFPRVHFKQHMLNGAPPGSLGVAHPSGWSTQELFNLFYQDNFIKYAKPTGKELV